MPIQLTIQKLLPAEPRAQLRLRDLERYEANTVSRLENKSAKAGVAKELFVYDFDLLVD